MPPPKAVFFGCSGPVLTEPERAFFATADPFGFILFKRNCVDPAQVVRLCGDLRDSIGRPEAPVLIDEEGGRVQRLGPPAWPDFPAAERYGQLARTDPEGAVRLAGRAAGAQAHQLSAMGIDADAAPVLDLAFEGASKVVGERSYGGDPARVAAFGRAVMDGLLAGGVMPVIKHLPGHGRARVDSHVGLPAIETGLERLRETDFAPFRALSDCPWGMAGHLLLPAIDAHRPASCSSAVIERILRGEIGFDGLLLTDDLSMGALEGSLGERAAACLEAGCDIAVHCNGVMAEMGQVAAVTGPLSDRAQARIERSRAVLDEARRPMGEALNVAAEMAAIAATLAGNVGPDTPSV